jgi:flagellar protein FliO/FliZ
VLELVLRLGVALGVVLGLFWLVARAGARRLGGGSRALVRVRGRQALSRTASVAVVEVGTRVLVVGVSDGGVRLLTELDPAEVETPVPAETADAEGTPTPNPTGTLGGSLLAPQTWRQAWAAATNLLSPTGEATQANGALRD